MASKIGRTFAHTLAAGLFAASFGLAAPAGAGTVPESSDPIKLGLLDWTGQEITMKVAGEILTRMGYSVEYVPTTNVPLFLAVADGDIHGFLEQWLVTTRKQFLEMKSEGKLEDLGLVGIAGRETWYYPAYVEEKCPGLPQWTALKDCAELFATAETLPKGRVVDYPEEWTPDSPKWIDALGLDLVAVSAGGEGAIIAEIKSAVARQEAVLVMFWEPHWAIDEYDMKGIVFPEFEPACEEDPSWGVNPCKTFDCGAPVPDIVKFVWPDFKDKYPAAYKVLKAFQFTNADQSPMIKAVDVDGVPAEKVAKKWVDENKDRWQPWVDAATM